MLSVATMAAASHPQLHKIVLCEQVPRYDDLQEVQEFATKVLHELWKECDYEFKSKIAIGKHELACHGEVRLARYGNPGERGEDGKPVDGIHLRGPSGRAMTTKSIISILEVGGLAVPVPLEETEGRRVPDIRYQDRRRSPAQELNIRKQDARKQEYDPRRQEQGPRWQEQGPRWQEQGPRRQKYGSKRQEHSSRRYEQGYRNQEQDQTPRRQGKREYWASQEVRRGQAQPRRQQDTFYWPTNNRYQELGN